MLRVAAEGQGPVGSPRAAAGSSGAVRVRSTLSPAFHCLNCIDTRLIDLADGRSDTHRAISGGDRGDCSCRGASGHDRRREGNGRQNQLAYAHLAPLCCCRRLGSRSFCHRRHCFNPARCRRGTPSHGMGYRPPGESDVHYSRRCLDAARLHCINPDQVERTCWPQRLTHPEARHQGLGQCLRSHIRQRPARFGGSGRDPVSGRRCAGSTGTILRRNSPATWSHVGPGMAEPVGSRHSRSVVDRVHHLLFDGRGNARNVRPSGECRQLSELEYRFDPGFDRGVRIEGPTSAPRRPAGAARRGGGSG